MNKERVRQVNKALKYELQFLYTKTLRDKYLITEHKRINTYKVKQTVEESYLHNSDYVECPMSYIKDSICNDLAKAIVKDTVFKIETSTIPYHVDIVGTVSVLSEGKVE